MSRPGTKSRGKSAEHLSEKDIKEKIDVSQENSIKDLSATDRAAKQKVIAHNNAVAESVITNLGPDKRTELKTRMTNAFESGIDAEPEALSDVDLRGMEPADQVALRRVEDDHKWNLWCNDVPNRPKRSKESRNLMAQYTIAVAGVMTGMVGAAALFYTIATANNRSSEGNTAAFDEAECKRLAKAWKDKPDAQFWDEVANYMEKNPEISMREEANALKVIQAMCDEPDWVFVSPAETDKAIDDFCKDIQVGNTAPAYREVMARKYLSMASQTTGTLLPRKVACEILSLAIARYQRSLPAS